MTPEELARQLAVLHEGSLKQLHQVIDGHKEYLQGLIQQAQAEIEGLAATGEKSTAQAIEVVEQPEGNAVTEETAVIVNKRKAAAAQEDADVDERPAKRRGRPAKRAKQPTISEEPVQQQDVGPEQVPENEASQQPSVSATVVAAQDAEAATADEATSAKPGNRRRPARGRAAATAEAVEGASLRTTRSRRAAAEPEPVAAAASTCSGRGRRAKPRAAAVPAALEAIAEDEEQQEQEQQQQLEQQQPQEEGDIPAKRLVRSANNAYAAVLDEATDGHQQQQQSAEGVVAEDGAEVGCDVEVLQQSLFDPSIVAAASAGAQDAGEAGTAACGALAELHQGVVVVDLTEQSPGAAEHVMQQHAEGSDVQHEEGKEDSIGLEEHPQLNDEDETEAPMPAEGPPKTPGFSLAPKSNQDMVSDTPCFVGQASRASPATQQQQQQVALDSPEVAEPVGADAGHPYSEAAAEGTSNDALPQSGGGLPQGSDGAKAQSLSFGEPLQAPLLQEPQAAAGSAAGAVGVATTAGPSSAAGTAAAPATTAPMDWKAFVSTMHPDDAPTPAVSRGRLRSQSGAGRSQQHSSLLRSTAAAAAAAAASPPLEVDQAAAAEDEAAAAAAPVSGRRITRSSMKQLRSPRLKALQSDDADFAADGERVDRAISFTPATNSKTKPVRSPRPSLPRSAKRSTAAMAAAVAAAEAAAEEAEPQQQQQQHEEEEVVEEDVDAAAAADTEMQDTAEQFDELDDAASPLNDADMPGTADLLDMHEPGQQQGALADDDQCTVAVARWAAGEQQQQHDEEEAEEIFHEVEEQQELDAGNADMAMAEDAVAAAEPPPPGAAGAVSGAPTAQPVRAPKPPVAAAVSGSSKAVNPVAAWLAATAGASAGAAGDKAKQQLEAAKDSKAAAAPAAGTSASATAAAGGGRGNLVSGIRSFVPSVLKKDVPAPVAAGKVKVKVKALEAAEAARKAEEAKAQERAARQQHKEQQQQQAKGRGAAEIEPAAAHKPQGTPSGAVAQSKVAAVERAAAGLSGSGGAVRVPAQQPEQEVSHKAADKDAAQRKAEKEAEAAKRAMDRAEREDRMKRAEQKRKEEEQKRRQDLAEKQRLKEERAAAAAAALKGNKAAGPKAAAAQPARSAVDKPMDKLKQAAADANSCKTPGAPKAATTVGAAAVAAGGEAGAAAAHGDSPSLTIKLLEPVSTDAKPKVAMGPPAPLGAKTPAAFKTPAPPVSEQEKRNVEALKSSPYVNTGTKRTPFTQQQKPDANSYIISPFRDDDVDTPDRSHKPVPEWARSHKLYEALKSQQHTDPDSIFGARQTTCDLADMFADVPVDARQQQHHRHKQRKLSQRTSSGDWSQDRLTWQEEVKYKKDMGYL